MSYLVLARKYRPQIFEDIAGQEHVTTTLRNAIVANRVAHAYLFTGARGVGKTTAARKLPLLPRSPDLQRTPQLWDLVEQNGIEAVRLQRRGNLEEEQYVLMFRETLIGSSQSSCPICLDDRSLAPVAARLLWLDRSFWLENLGDAESVQVNGQSIDPGETIALQTGMRLRFGKTTVKFERARQMHL